MGRHACALLFVILAGAGASPAPATAPNFALENNRGIMVFRSSIGGNQMISFFASYCAPCRKELPLLIDIEKKYGREKGLSLVLVATDVSDSEGDARDKAERFLKKIGVKHDFLVDRYQMVVKKYNPSERLPATYLVDRRGAIMFSEVGARADTIRRLEEAIRNIR